MMNRRALQQSRGVVVAAVLVFMAIASALAIALIAAGRDGMREARAEGQEIAARLLLDSALERGLFALTRAGDPMLKDLRQLRPVYWQWNGETVSLDLDIESGKIDVNMGNLDLITAALAHWTDRTAATTILTRIRAARLSATPFITPAAVLDPAAQFTAKRDALGRIFTAYTGAEGLDPLSIEEPVRSALEPKAGGVGSAKSFVLSSVSPERPIYTLTARWKSRHREYQRRVVFFVRDFGTAPMIIRWGDGDWFSQERMDRAFMREAT
jgi:hypothetical protein